MKRANLTLHCGAAAVTRDEVLSVEAPACTDTWHPIPHRSVLTTIEAGIRGLGFEITGEAHALTQGGLRYFGLLEVVKPEADKDEYNYVVGVRGTLDKSYAAGLCAGAQAFVCDNLSFHSEITIARKYTKNIETDLPVLTARAIGLLSQRWTEMDDRVEAYKHHDVSPMEAHDVIIRAFDAGVITAQQVTPVLKNWRTPPHPEFAARNAWSLFNAFTEAGKGVALATWSRRSSGLFGVLDGQCGLVSKSYAVAEGTTDSDVKLALN